jgi:hypothetical protein
LSSFFSKSMTLRSFLSGQLSRMIYGLSRRERKATKNI